MAREKKLRNHFANGAQLYRIYCNQPACVEEKRIVTITRLMGKRQRELDEDGLYSALKPCLDAMRDAGWIYNDSPRWVHYTALQERAEDRVAAIRVEIEHAPSPV